jgi:hypothetical protein
MAKLCLKKEDENTLAIEEGDLAREDNVDDEAAFAVLQKLETDETRLSEQKEHLSLLFEQLQLKVREEIEIRKRRVQKLNSEVTDLKMKCEKFARWINTGELPK